VIDDALLIACAAIAAATVLLGGIGIGWEGHRLLSTNRCGCAARWSSGGRKLAAEAAEQVRRRYAATDKQVDDLNWKMEQITDQANKDIRDAVKAVQAESDGGQWNWSGAIHAPRVSHQVEDRWALTGALSTGIDAQARGAQLALERQEADLLRQLAMGALETEEARAFLRAIPSVGELVPASRLAEIEAAFDEEKGGQR
jgi:hypothetical protein